MIYACVGIGWVLGVLSVFVWERVVGGPFLVILHDITTDGRTVWGRFGAMGLAKS